MYQTKKEWIKAETYLCPEDGEKFELKLFNDEKIYRGTYLGNQSVQMDDGRIISYNLVESYKNSKAN